MEKGVVVTRMGTLVGGALAVIVLAASGCSPDQNSVKPAPTAQKQSPTNGPIVLLGNDPAALKRYLQTVQEVKPIHFDVEWNPDVVAIDREAAIRTLLSVSADGTRFAFTSGDPALAALAPGKILFLWGVALRRITSVQPDGDQLIVVTSGVSLPEAFRQADIEFDYHIPSNAPIVVPHEQAVTAPATAMAPATRPLFMNVSATTAPLADTTGEPTPAPAPAAPDVVFDLGSNTYMVTDYQGFDIDVKYGPQGDGIAFLLEARWRQDDLSDQDKTEAERRTEERTRQNAISNDYKKTANAGQMGPLNLNGKTRDLFKIGSSQLDLRLRAEGTFRGTSTNDGLSVGSKFLIEKSALTLMRTNFNNVNGTLKYQFIARRGEKSEQWINKFKVELPMRFTIPVIVGGVPLMFQVAFNFIATPSLATKNDAFSGNYEIPFGGNLQVSITDGKFKTSGTLKTIPQVLQSLGSSIGVSAVLISMQAPRVGLGMDLNAASSIAYIDLVSTATITSAGTLGMFPCRNSQLVSTINAGMDTQPSGYIAGIAKVLGSQPLNDALKKASNFASIRKTVYRKEWYRNEPDIKACQLGKK